MQTTKNRLSQLSSEVAQVIDATLGFRWVLEGLEGKFARFNVYRLGKESTLSVGLHNEEFVISIYQEIDNECSNVYFHLETLEQTADFIKLWIVSESRRKD